MTTLRPLLLDTRDGEWGKGEPGPDRVEMRVIRGTDFPAVREGQVSRVPTRYLERRHADRKRLQPWDIVIETAGGSPDRPTGRTILMTPRIFELLGKDIACASFARFLRVDRDQVDPAFLFWMLQHHYERRDLLQFHTQHTGVARFQFTTFSNGFEFELPPTATQCRIASILGAYDDLITANRRRVTVLEKMALELFEEWFVRFRFPGHEDTPIADCPAGSVPRGWSAVPFGTLLVTSIGGLWGEPASTERSPIKVSVVRGTDFPKILSGTYLSVPDRYVSERELRDRRVNAGDIIMEASGGSKDQPVGRVLFMTASLLDHLGAPVAPASFCKLLRTTPEAGLSDYVHALLQAMYRDGRIEKFQKQSTGLRNLSIRQLSAEPVVRPAAGIVEAFGRLIRPLTEAASVYRHECSILAASRDLLLPRLISGQLNVDDAERELEEAA